MVGQALPGQNPSFQPPLQPVWPQGFRGMVPPIGLEPLDGHGWMRAPSPQPQVLQFPQNGMSGRSIEVPVVVNDGSLSGRRKPEETKGSFPPGMPGARSLSPGPPQVPFQQPQMHSSRSVSPRPYIGGPPSMQATPRQPTPPPATTQMQKHISMPAGLLARLDGVVSGMEKELREADQDPRTLNKPDGHASVDWLNKQIQMLQDQRKTEMHPGGSKQIPAMANDVMHDGDQHEYGRLTLLEKEHIALKQRLEEELRVVRATAAAKERESKSDHVVPLDEGPLSVRGSIATAARHSQHSLATNEELRSRRGSVLVPERLSQHSLPGSEELRSLKGSASVPERLSQQAVPTNDELRSLRSSLAMAERLSQNSALPNVNVIPSARSSQMPSARSSQVNEIPSARSSQMPSARSSQVALDLQFLEARLRETEAALERQQRVSEEAIEAHQAAESSLHSLEDKSQHVLRDCRDLQTKVVELETERDGSLRHIAELEEEIRAYKFEPLASQSSERIQVLDLQGKLSVEAARTTEAEIELADVKVERDDYHHQVKTALARISELEDRLGQALASKDRKDGEFQLHLDRIQDLEDLLATHQGTEADYQRQLLESQRKVDELKTSEARLNSELDHYRSEIKKFEEQHKNIADVHARTNATQRSQIVAYEQQIADAEAVGNASLRQYQQRVQDLEKELYTIQASKENMGNMNYGHKVAIKDLEQQIEILRTDKDRHTKQENQHRARIQELEQQYDALQAEENTERRLHTAAKQRILELGQEIEDSSFAKDSLSRQLQAQKQRVATLEEELEQLQLTDADHHRQHHQNRTKISEFEAQVHALFASDENHKRQHQSNSERIESLLAELESARDQHRKHAEEITTHKNRVGDLDRFLADAQALAGRHAAEASTHHERTLELDKELVALRTKEAALRDTHDRTLQEKAERIAHLETFVEVARNAEAGNAELERKVARLELELGQERTQVAKLERDLNEEKGQLEKTRSGLELAKRMIEEGENSMKGEAARKGIDAQRIAQLEKEVDKKQLRIEELQVQLELERNKTNEVRSQAMLASSLMLPTVNSTIQDDMAAAYAQKPSSMASPSPFATFKVRDAPNTSMAAPNSSMAAPNSSMTSGFLTLSREEVRSKHRQDSSLAGPSQKDSTKRSLAATQHALKRSNTFMPDSNDPVVVKLRDVDLVLRECLEECYESHTQTIEDQLANMIEAYEEGKEFRDGLMNFNPTFVSERQAASVRIENIKQDLQYLKREVEENAVLIDAGQQKDIMDRIKLDIDKCEDEFRLLQTASPLLAVPEGTLQTLMEVYEQKRDGQPLSNENWADGFSPMHWAAQNGRRDIINYLLSVDGGTLLLNARDKKGHPPLYYANGDRRPALAQFLIDSGANAPMHSVEARPDISMLPTNYQKVLQHIETHGWHTMNWKDGFTMLHWAAEKGLPDLCRYLITMDADPSARDNKYRKAADCAREAGHRDVAKLLQDIEDKPIREFNLQAFAPSGSSRPVRNIIETRSRFSTGNWEPGSDDKSDGSVGSNEGIPEPYIHVLEQIDRVGWNKMVWARNFTLLHWAGKNDRPDLCAYFMFVKADPNHRDDSGKSALDYATEAQSTKAKSQLLKGPPDKEPRSNFLISKKPRGSVSVEARARASVEHLLGPAPALTPTSHFGGPQSFMHDGSAGSEDSEL